MRETGVKICGVTRVRDAELAVNLGADFIGLNFWPGSSRCVSVAQARRIADAVIGRVSLIGVWVNPEQEAVRTTAAEVGLDLLQFHGDETPAQLRPFGGWVIKAFRVDADFDARQLAAFVDAWGFLFDCAPPDRYGGSGESWPYERISEIECTRPVLLAGGLTAENVADAIARSRADIVDVCSGVESAPGIKDPVRMRRFFDEVRHVQKVDR